MTLLDIVQTPHGNFADISVDVKKDAFLYKLSYRYTIFPRLTFMMPEVYRDQPLGDEEVESFQQSFLAQPNVELPESKSINISIGGCTLHEAASLDYFSERLERQRSENLAFQDQLSKKYGRRIRLSRAPDSYFRNDWFLCTWRLYASELSANRLAVDIDTADEALVSVSFDSQEANFGLRTELLEHRLDLTYSWPVEETWESKIVGNVSVVTLELGDVTRRATEFD